MLAENSNRAISLLLSEYTNICKKAKYQILKYFNDVSDKFLIELMKV